ncbi:MAG TPA: hypothetical protein ACHBZ9_07575, partial [Arsenophonus nasoniae]|uniref:hypothetical protein n=1 Tax=Arsenophonus nasoniae TaxID=638 RepID=UPI0038799B36
SPRNFLNSESCWDSDDFFIGKVYLGNIAICYQNLSFFSELAEFVLMLQVSVSINIKTLFGWLGCASYPFLPSRYPYSSI